MSADAMARLRAELKVMGDHGLRYCEQVRTDDLRAVLGAHDEALDALVKVHEAEKRFGEDGNGFALAKAWSRVTAVLAKAGRR